MSFAHCSLLLECSKCQAINYLDPFTFWFFKGKVKCAGCDAIWAVEINNGTRVGAPTAATPPHDKLPGLAQTKDYKKDWRSPDKVSAAPQARPDFQGKPIPIYKNVRGKLISGGPLKPEDLVGSRPKFILEGRPYK